MQNTIPCGVLGFIIPHESRGAVCSHVKLRMVLITSMFERGVTSTKGAPQAVWEIEVEAEVEGEQPVGPRCRPSRVHQRATHTVVAHEKAVFSTTQCVVCMIGLCSGDC